jgi:transcriptional regulator with XRE-family HTH domain
LRSAEIRSSFPFMAGINGAAVRVLREKDGQSATEFAERVGITLKYLSDIERDQRNLRRNPALVKRIAEALNVPLSAVQERVGDGDEQVAS